MTVRVLPMGSQAMLVDEIGEDPAAWAGGLRALRLPGVVEVVPAARTVLVACADPGALARVRARLSDVVVAREAATAESVIEIGVRYDGADLHDVAASAGLEVDEVVTIHTAPTYHVAFCGFAPGFGYLRGLDARLHLPRRATPRTSVPSGAVAIAAEYTAVYPRRSPGGWHLIGSTEAVMFDPHRARPALLEPGAHVRFVAT